MKRKDLKDLLDKHYDNYRFSDSLHGETLEYVLDAMEEAITVAHSSTKLPVDKLQELIDETYNWQVQDLDADTLEDSLKLGIREGALVVKHYFDKK